MVEFDKTFTLPYTILRFGSLYGPRADNNNGIKKLIKSAKTKKKLFTGEIKWLLEDIFMYKMRPN